MSDDSQPNRRILIIDDNESIHEDFRKILGEDGASRDLDQLEAALFGGERGERGPGYEVDTALQGEEGFQKVCDACAADRRYALAFVDMRMPPGWDGLETIERIWQEDPLVQIVMCTAYSDYSWDEIRSRIGHTDRLLLLRKPFDNAEVLQLAMALTNKWTLARQARLKLEELENMVHERTEELERVNAQLRQEITERTAAQERLRHDAFHDGLTGLPNRSLLLHRLRECSSRALRDSTYVYAVLFLDIDNFKVINDGLGHRVGDELLVQMAERLTASLRGVDSVIRDNAATTSRLGGDEFVILLDGIGGAEDAARVADRIREQLATPFRLAEREITITTSMGIAMPDEGPRTGEELLRDADTAMYRAKQGGKNRYAVFNHAMHAEVKSRLQLETDLHRALEREQLTLHYQPIIQLRTRRLHGFEALLRWNHPEHGQVPPGVFIPIAEETGLIIPIGRWALREATRQHYDWLKSSGDRELSISVNVSRRQIVEAGFVEDVQRIVHAAGLPTSALKLEITESVIMADPALIIRVLRQLAAQGMHFHIDDFGTGLSSLHCLHQFPLTGVKLDRAFISEIGVRPSQTAVVQAVVNLAHNLNIEVIAEGIETQEQLGSVISLGCDLGQGFAFSKALPPERAQDLIEVGTAQVASIHQE